MNLYEKDYTHCSEELLKLARKSLENFEKSTFLHFYIFTEKYLFEWDSE